MKFRKFRKEQPVSCEIIKLANDILKICLKDFADETYMYNTDNLILHGCVFVIKDGCVYNKILSGVCMGKKEYVRCFTDGNFITNEDKIMLSEASWLITSVGTNKMERDYRAIYYYNNITNDALDQCIKILKSEVRYADKIF